MIGVVAIGRNEGERLKACLRSVSDAPLSVYVDSGSADGSVAFARSIGAEVVMLDTAQGFTAARARNAGLAALKAKAPDLRYVQMVDGDCEVAPGWIASARAVLDADPGLAVVFGRRRERFPDASVYNALTDDEWNVPVGEANACGGDALFRVTALDQVNGYSPTLIAGEEPDMCLRMRQHGWRIRRIDVEMTLHDAALTRFSQYWRRTKRAGHAFAELAWRHGAAADPHWRREVKSMILWAALLPAAILLLTALLGWPALALLLVYPLQILRIARRERARGLPPKVALASGAFLVIGKFAQLGGLLRFHVNRLTKRRGGLIEYKGAEPA